MYQNGSSAQAPQTTETPLQAWIGYLRVSTNRQADSGLGLDAQRAQVIAAAKARGIEDVRWVVESASGSSVKRRPLLVEALEELRLGNAAGMIVAKLDRLSRSVGDHLNLQAQAQAQGWDLVALDLPTDSSTPMGEAMATMMATFNQLERRLIATRTREAMAAAKARGSRLGRPRSDRANTLADRAIELRAQGLTFQAVADTFNGEGIETLRGGTEWRPSNVQALLRLRRLDGEAVQAKANNTEG